MGADLETGEGPMAGDDWKDAMFKRHAAAFDEILTRRNSSLDLGGLIRPAGGANDGRFATLDLGCGSGRLLPKLAAVSTITVGLDYSLDLLSLAGERLSDAPSVCLVAADF